MAVSPDNVFFLFGTYIWMEDEHTNIKMKNENI